MLSLTQSDPPRSDGKRAFVGRYFADHQNPAVRMLWQRLVDAEGEAQTQRQEAERWQEAALTAAAEQDRLKSEVEESHRFAQALLRELEEKESRTIVRLHPPQVFVLGGPGQEWRTAERICEQNNVRLVFLPPEAVKGNTRGIRRMIRHHSVKSNAVIIITPLLHRDKQAAAEEMCDLRGTPCFHAQALTRDVLEIAVRELQPKQICKVPTAGAWR